MSQDNESQSNADPNAKQVQPTLRLRPELSGHLKKLVDDCFDLLSKLHQAASSSGPPLPSKEDHYKQARCRIPRSLENNTAVRKFVELVSSFRYKAWIRRLTFIYFTEAHPITDRNLVDNSQYREMLAFYRKYASVTNGQERLQLIKLVTQLAQDKQLPIDLGQVKEKVKLINNRWSQVDNSCDWVFRQLRDFSKKEVSMVRQVIRRQYQDILDGLMVINQLSNDVILAVEAVK